MLTVSLHNDGLSLHQFHARPCFFDLIPARSYECLRWLCEIVDLCAKYQISEADLILIKTKMQKHHMLCGSSYGKLNVSVNNHMALHLHETIDNFGREF